MARLRRVTEMLAQRIGVRDRRWYVALAFLRGLLVVFGIALVIAAAYWFGGL